MFPRRGSPERLSRPPHVTCRRWNMALQQSWIPNFYCQVRQGGVVRFLFFQHLLCVSFSSPNISIHVSCSKSCSGCSLLFSSYLLLLCVFLLLSPLGFSFFPVYQMWTYHYDGLRWELADDWRLNSSWNSVGVESPRWIQKGVECMWPATVSIIMIYNDFDDLWWVIM